jgi:hypothetical protein
MDELASIIYAKGGDFTSEVPRKFYLPWIAS